MKKLLLLAAAFIMLGIAPVSAQTKTAVKQTNITKTTQAGKPDRRFKANKATTTTTATTTAGPTKKDGTPDMRYKANKTTTSTTIKKK
jgi:hypothetical protein